MQSLSEKVKIVKNSSTLSRHLVATAELSPGDVILEEQPLLVAPFWECEQMKCSQCLQDSFVMCKKCEFFPLCIDCTTHNSFDCDFFCEGAAGAEISKNLLVENYAISGVLKLLLLMENPAYSEQCAALSATPGANVVDSDAWQEQDSQIVTPLLQSGIARAFKRVKVTHELLHTLCWRIDANAFEVTASDGNTLKGVYVCGAQLPHNCVPNTVVTFDESFRLILYASVRIHAGDIIYNTYTNPLMGTSQRQHELRLTKGIECACARCSDPVELGTHMSSLKCSKCANGFVVCLAPDGNDGGEWKCTNCAATMATEVVKQLLVDVGESLLEANSELLAYENLLAKYSAHFHQNHFVLVEIKQNIASILRAVLMNPMCIPGKDLLERKLELCEEILPLVRAVLPGVSKLYGIALYEYLLSYMEHAELVFEDKEAENAALIFQEKLEDARDIAAKAKEMLRFEPSNSPEGHLVSRIAMEQKRIDENLRQLNSKRSCA